MSTERTAWHPPFTGLLQDRGPRWTRVSGEVSLSQEPARVDDLIELRVGTERDPSDTGTVLRGMWPFLRCVGLLEFKSHTRPLRRGDLSRLLQYGYTWFTAHQGPTSLLAPDGTRRRASAEDLALFLVVPRLSPTLLRELKGFGMKLLHNAQGYHPVVGAGFTFVVIDLAHAAKAEGDELMAFFTGVRRALSVENFRWIGQHTNRGGKMDARMTDEAWNEWHKSYLAAMPIEERLEGVTLKERLSGLKPEERLSGLKPEERLSGLKPEERLSGLKPEEIARAMSPGHAVLLLPDEALRALAEDYVATLSPEVQAAVRARRGA